MRSVQVSLISTVGVVLAMTYNLISDPVGQISDESYGPAQNSLDWTAYGGSHAGTRYVPHRLIAERRAALLHRVPRVASGVPGPNAWLVDVVDECELGRADPDIFGGKKVAQFVNENEKTESQNEQGKSQESVVNFCQ